jgi:hypothetical protein
MLEIINNKMELIMLKIFSKFNNKSRYSSKSSVKVNYKLFNKILMQFEIIIIINFFIIGTTIINNY